MGVHGGSAELQKLTEEKRRPATNSAHAWAMQTISWTDNFINGLRAFSGDCTFWMDVKSFW